MRANGKIDTLQRKNKETQARKNRPPRKISATDGMDAYLPILSYLCLFAKFTIDISGGLRYNIYT